MPPHVICLTIKVVGLHNRKFRLAVWHGDRPALISYLLRDQRIRSATGDENENVLISKAREGCSIEIVSNSTHCPSVQREASAWVITAATINPQFAMEDRLIPEDKDRKCSHHSEVRGLVGKIAHWSKIAKKHNIARATVEINCNGLEALKKSRRLNYRPNTSIAQFDIIASLYCT